MDDHRYKGSETNELSKDFQNFEFYEKKIKNSKFYRRVNLWNLHTKKMLKKHISMLRIETFVDNLQIK